MLIEDTAKTIVCYGDSNTWGQVPGTQKRHIRSKRWPYILQKIVGNGYEIISEGLIGRTLVIPDSIRPHYPGITYLPGLLLSHNPIDLIIIMLGTNETKSRYNLEVQDIARDLEVTIELIQNQKNLEKRPAILVVCPPAPITSAEHEIRADMARAPKMFKILPSLFKEVTEKYKCHYLNAGDYVVSSSADGYHLDAQEHLKLAGAIADLINTMKL